LALFYQELEQASPGRSKTLIDYVVIEQNAHGNKTGAKVSA
jgi:hypothetical protein